MGFISQLLPKGRARHYYDFCKASMVNFCFREGATKNAWRVRHLDHHSSIWLPYLINRGDVVAMVGSPHPQTIELMSRCVGAKGRVVLVEPEKENLKNHYSHIERYNLHNIAVVPKAAYNYSGKAKFLIAPHVADHRIWIPEIEHDNDYRKEAYYVDAIDMEVDTLDNIFRELGLEHIDYIAIMINGAELHALEGMEKTLPRTKRLFVKGHARKRTTKQPLHEQIRPYLETRGFHTALSRPSSSVSKTVEWEKRAGDVYAWRPYP
jgi:FkbM family methyltransferase